MNPFRGDVLPLCAFLVCLLYVSEDFLRLHVHFRSSLTWYSLTSPGAPSLLFLDAMRFFTSDINLEDWVMKVHITSQGQAA